MPVTHAPRAWRAGMAAGAARGMRTWHGMAWPRRQGTPRMPNGTPRRAAPTTMSTRASSPNFFSSCRQPAGEQHRRSRRRRWAQPRLARIPQQSWNKWRPRRRRREHPTYCPHCRPSTHLVGGIEPGGAAAHDAKLQGAAAGRRRRKAARRQGPCRAQQAARRGAGNPWQHGGPLGADRSAAWLPLLGCRRCREAGCAAEPRGSAKRAGEPPMEDRRQPIDESGECPLYSACRREGATFGNTAACWLQRSLQLVWIRSLWAHGVWPPRRQRPCCRPGPAGAPPAIWAAALAPPLPRAPSCILRRCICASVAGRA